jgi:hypothetical protein
VYDGGTRQCPQLSHKLCQSRGVTGMQLSDMCDGVTPEWRATSPYRLLLYMLSVDGETAVESEMLVKNCGGV